jgi:hypothetical protein
VLPFLLVPYPPIMDLPAHAARLFIECNSGDPSISAMYAVRLGIIPNLAIDLINRPLCGLVEPVMAFKLMTVVTLAGLFGAFWAIQRKLLGRPNILLLLVPALSVNLITMMGYLNFLIGVAVLAWMIVLVIGRLEDRLRLIIVGNLGGIILFFSHIFALALGMVVFFGLQLPRAMPRLGEIVGAGLRTLVAFIMPLLLIPLVAAGDNRLDVNFGWKLRPPFAITYTNSDYLLTGLTIWALFMGAAFLVYRRASIRLHPVLTGTVIAVALYVLLLPAKIGDATDVDARVAVMLYMLAICAAVLTAAPDRRREASMTVIVIAGLLVTIHLAMAATTWMRFSREVAEFRAALDVLPRNASVFSVSNTVEQTAPSGVNEKPYTHLVSYATIDRRIFNPLEFTGVGMQPLVAIGRFALLDTPVGMPATIEQALVLDGPLTARQRAQIAIANLSYSIGWSRKFDYVVLYHFGRPVNFFPMRLRPVREGSFFTIFAVRRD